MQTFKHLEADLRAARARASDRAKRIRPIDVPKGARLVDVAENGEVAVYIKDDKDVLMMIYKRPGWPAQILFENSRHWPKPEAAAK
jgi:hypothetical protein